MKTSTVSPGIRRTGVRINRALLPKYVRCVRAKGRAYYYFDTGKKVDGKKVYARLPDLKDPSFWQSHSAMMGHRNRKPRDLLTVPALIDLYHKSKDYRRLAANSKAKYDIYLRRLAELMPTAPVAEITRADMTLLIDKMADKPGAANLFLGTSGALFKWAADRSYIPHSPTKGIKPIPGGEHAKWPLSVLNAALASDDDQLRLLVHLLLYTAQRLNDALSLCWSDIVDGRIVMRQQKTGKELSIKMHHRLKAELARHPMDNILIATNPNTGKRYGEQVARAMMQDFAKQFGVSVVPHGLRKNAVIALLEAGCTMAETAAISGQTLGVVEQYAKGRDQTKLGDAAVLRWEANGS